MKRIQVDELEFDILIDYEAIQKRIEEIADILNRDYEGRKPVFVGVLNGSFMFMADLMKRLDIICEMAFVKLSSYKGKARGHITELIGLEVDLSDRDVIVVEDIIDTGHSLHHTLQAITRYPVRSLLVCALLTKPEALEFEFDHMVHVGFEIAKEFVIGYGLDLNGTCRNLPHIYQLVQ